MSEINSIYGMASGIAVNSFPKKNNTDQKIDPVIQRKVEELEPVFSAFNRSIKVKVEGDMYVAEVYDKETKKVVKTIPAEKVIEVRNRIHETISKFLDSNQ